MGYPGLVTLHFFWQPVTVINFSDIDETMESVNKIDIHEGDGTTEATALWKILNDISTNWKLLILIFEANIL